MESILRAVHRKYIPTRNFQCIVLRFTKFTKSWWQDFSRYPFESFWPSWNVKNKYESKPLELQMTSKPCEKQTNSCSQVQTLCSPPYLTLAERVFFNKSGDRQQDSMDIWRTTWNNDISSPIHIVFGMCRFCMRLSASEISITNKRIFVAEIDFYILLFEVNWYFQSYDSWKYTQDLFKGKFYCTENLSKKNALIQCIRSSNRGKASDDNQLWNAFCNR